MLSYWLCEWIFIYSLPSFFLALTSRLLLILELLSVGLTPVPLISTLEGQEPNVFTFGVSLTISNPQTCLPSVFSPHG